MSTSYILELYQRIDYVQQVQLKESEIRALSLYNEANAANRAKSDFLSVMSHELRSPLISVRGVAEMMEQQFLGPLSDKYRDYATDVRTSADHLVSIINDILDYSKMTGGKWELAAQDIDGAVLIQESITLIQGLLHEKNITVETRISAPLTLHLDARLGRQMLTNLLSNAVKFSPEKSRIIVTLERLEDGAARISVTDHGKGIPEADLARVLLPFEQVSDPHQRDTGGTGLGLPFVVEAMRQHGGTLELESTVNVGTTVKLLFPAARVVAA
ncbi:MAG: sensor histidine kinase [Holosporales bacterium]